MARQRSLVAIANAKISFPRAAQWVRVGGAVRERGMKTACPSCGEADALRVYPDHGYCFAEQSYFSPVGLLAEVWEMDHESTAIRALDKIGYVPAGYAHLWDEAQREPVPALDELAAALRIWCERTCPDWRKRQYEEAVALRLSRCLGLLRLVRTRDDCRQWLNGCKAVMGKALSQD
jgi:hypothetical protein